MTPDSGVRPKLSEVLRTGSFRQIVLGYIVGAWALLEIVVTVAELAGWPLAVPRWLVVVMAGGLILVVVTAATIRSARALRAASPLRREILGVVMSFVTLLPMSFIVRDGSIRWIMWRDSPGWAAACGAFAIVLVSVWALSKPAASSDPALTDADQESG